MAIHPQSRSVRGAGIRNALFNSRHGSKTSKRALFWPIVEGNTVNLYPCDWGHVEDAYNAMAWRHNTICRPSGLSASSVNLTSESKMRVQPVR